MTERQLSPRAQASLEHLRRLKPLDGYSIESYLSTSGRELLRLKRRNIPLRDVGFLDLIVSRSRIGEHEKGCVVGIQDMTSDKEFGRGVVLVNHDGTVAAENLAPVTVKMDDALIGKPTSKLDRSSRSATMAPPNFTTTPLRTAVVSDADNEMLLQYGLAVLGALVLMKLIFTTVNVLAILLLPVLYFYANQTCPPIDTFDAKKELKRVMRGAHLPHEEQPKGFFERSLNRLAASIGTELATSLGYEISIHDYAGAAKLATVRVPVAGADFFWVGIFGRWRFVGQRESPGNKVD